MTNHAAGRKHSVYRRYYQHEAGSSRSSQEETESERLLEDCIARRIVDCSHRQRSRDCLGRCVDIDGSSDSYGYVVKGGGLVDVDGLSRRVDLDRRCKREERQQNRSEQCRSLGQFLLRNTYPADSEFSLYANMGKAGDI